MTDTDIDLSPDQGTLSRWADHFRVTELQQAARVNAEDPWFRERVAMYLRLGWYYSPSLQTTGYDAEDDWVFIEPGAEGAVEKAWLTAAAAWRNGHRLHEKGY